jgi:RND family efflux transporter MFP subunit
MSSQLSKRVVCASGPGKPGRRILLATAMLLLALAGGCGKPPPEEEQVVRPVKIFTVGELKAARVRDYPGTVRAAQNADMAFEVPGRITEFLVKEGQRVEKGDVLARLDSRDYDAELDKQNAILRKAKADLQRSTNILREDPGAISRDQIDRDQRAVGVARASVAQAQKAVEDTVLVAPFAGVMARKLVEDFQNVQAKEPVLVLQDLTHLEIEVSVPERDMVGGQAGMSQEELTRLVNPRVRVSAIPDREFPARIKEIATTADPVTRTFQVKLIFEPPDDVTILPGMTARVIASPSKAGATLIPANAPRAEADGKPYVWLLDPDTMTVSRRPVELGNLTGGNVEVVSGLKEGDQIAISGVRVLEEGMQVRRYERTRGAAGS